MVKKIQVIGDKPISQTISFEEKMERFSYALSITEKLPPDMIELSQELLQEGIIQWASEQTLIEEGILSYEN